MTAKKNRTAAAVEILTVVQGIPGRSFTTKVYVPGNDRRDEVWNGNT